MVNVSTIAFLGLVASGVNAAGLRASAPLPTQVDDKETVLAAGTAMQALHESRRIRDENTALDLPSDSIDMDALEALGVNMEAPLSLADNPNELMSTKAFLGKLSTKHLQLLDKSSRKPYLSLSIASIKMPIIDMSSSDRCFQLNYQPKGASNTLYAFCAPTSAQARKWQAGIMATRFVQNAGIQGSKSAEESKLPERSTKEYRWYKHVQESLKAAGDSQANELLTPEQFAQQNVVNVEVRNAHRTPQVTVNGHKIDYTKAF